MGKSGFKRLLSAFLCVCMVAMMAPMAFAADSEEQSTVVNSSDELKTAVADAQSGDTITLGEGEFSTYKNPSPKKSLTFVGSGSDKTVWKIGNIPAQDQAGEYNSDYSFDGCDTITFKNMKMVNGTKDYMGFTRIENLNFENCTFEGRGSYWGYQTTTFKDCTFTAPAGDYVMWDYTSPTMTFNNCVFNSASGKFINAYIEKGENTERTLNLTDCKFNADKKNKPAVCLKSFLNTTWKLNITGCTTNFEDVTLDADDVYTDGKYYSVRTKDNNGTCPANTTVSIDGKTVWKNGAPVVEVAEVNGKTYSSLAEAVAAAGSGDTVKLLKNVTVDTPIYIVKNVVVDLNNNNIIAGCKYVFTIQADGSNPGGSLKVTGKGTIDCDSKNGTFYLIGSETSNSEKYAKLVIDQDVNIINGKYAFWIDRVPSKDVSYNVSVDIYGKVTGHEPIYVTGNIHATEGNVPAINIHSGAVFNLVGAELYLAGYAKTTIDDGVSMTNTDSNVITIAAGELTINGGTFTGGNKLGSEMGTGGAINVSTSSAVYIQQHGTNLPTKVTINGGTFTAAVPFYQEKGANEKENKGQSAPELVELAINGGNFASNRSVADGGVAVKSDDKTGFISGGLFSTKFDRSYCAAGLTVVGNTDTATKGTYPWTVGEAGENPADVAAGAPTVNEPTVSGKTDADKELLNNTQNALKNSTPAVTGTGVETAATDVANKNTVTATDNVVSELNNAIGNGSNVTADKTNIVIQTYMDMTITGVDATADKKSISVEIQPMYRTVATTADVNKGGEIVLAATDTKSVNAVEVAKPQKLNVQAGDPVKVKIPVPDNFVTDASHLVVKHEKNGTLVGYHKADYDANNHIITFTNNKGFSTFTVLSDARSASIQFTDKDGKKIDSATYGPSNVNDALPTTAAESGYVFNGWKFEGVNGVYTSLTDDLLTALSGKNIKATPDFSKRSSGSSGSSSGSSSNTFKVTTSAVNNGGVNASPSNAAKGKTITITLSPDKGYKLGSLTVTDGSGKTISTTKKSDTVYTFTMPASQVKVGVTYVKEDSTVTEPTTGFSDVAASAWYADAVKYAVDKGMMNGIGSGKFAPDGTTSRGMIVTVLYRLEGEPAVSAASFTDVAADAYYAKAVAWASANGIVTGYGNGKFGPNDAITREQFAAILYRYAQYKKYDVSVGENTNILSFEDAQSISSYAIPAIQWACGAGVMNGSNGYLTPKSGATRAQAAQLLMNFCENVKK